MKLKGEDVSHVSCLQCGKRIPYKLLDQIPAYYRTQEGKNENDKTKV